MESGKTMQMEYADAKEWIELDQDKINNSILNSGKFTSKELEIKKWDITELYLASITKNKSSYIGGLNRSMKRQNYGINTYENGDKYVGYFDKDLRSKHGAYMWAPKTSGDTIQSETYYGFWREDIKENQGVYLWLTEKKSKMDFDTAKFEAFVGEFDFDKYRRGCYFTKNEDNLWIYYGNFDEDGKKNDDSAFFCSAKGDRVMHGKVHDDKFINAYVAFFKEEDGTLEDIVFCEFEKDETPSNFLLREQIEEGARTKIEDTVVKFRNMVTAKDYFLRIYQKFRELDQFATIELTNIAVLEDEKKYQQLKKLSTAYNEIEIYRELEKAFS